MNEHALPGLFSGKILKKENRLVISSDYYILIGMNKKTPTGLVQLLREKCAEHSLRLTPQRIAIYEALYGDTNHPSTDGIYRKIKKQFPSLSFDTVNRTLLTFAQIGLTGVVEGYGDPKRFDPNLKPHHHFRCMACGCIEDIYNDSFDRVPIPEKLRKQYAIRGKKVVLEGYCKTCQKKKQ